MNLQALDEGVGQIIRTLQSKGVILSSARIFLENVDLTIILGLYQNSVIIFTTDNGGSMRKRSNLPLKGDKESLYEGGIRGVGFVMSPLIEKPKREYNQYDKYHISIQSFILFFTTS